MIFKRLRPPDLSAGWRGDPSGDYRLRWWNGAQRTRKVVLGDGQESIDDP